MRKKLFIKALKSKTPANNLYRLIPKNEMENFKRFARCFGFTEEDIKRALSDER